MNSKDKHLTNKIVWLFLKTIRFTKEMLLLLILWISMSFMRKMKTKTKKHRYTRMVLVSFTNFFKKKTIGAKRCFMRVFLKKGCLMDGANSLAKTAKIISGSFKAVLGSVLGSCRLLKKTKARIIMVCFS